MQLIGGERQKTHLSTINYPLWLQKNVHFQKSHLNHMMSKFSSALASLRIWYIQKFSEIFEHVQGFCMLKVCWSQSLFYHIDFDSHHEIGHSSDQRVLVKPNTCVQYFHDHNSTHQLCYQCEVHISINDATTRTQQTIMIFFHKNEACAKLTHLGSIHPLLPLILNEISGTFLPGQVGGVHLTFRIRVSLSTFVWLIFLMTSRCNPSLSSLLIDGRFTCTPVGGGAIFRSLLRKSSHRLHKCTQRKSIKQLHINHISSLDAQKPLFPHRKVCNATRWDKELSL